MKRIQMILFFAMFAFVSCEEEPPVINHPKDPTSNDTNHVTNKTITYPDSVYYGNNILLLPDSSILTEYFDYEIGAILTVNTRLKLVITNCSAVEHSTGHTPIWFYDIDEIGWIIDDYNESDHNQKMTSSQTGRISSLIMFESYGGNGECKIDFYENADSITQTKHFFW